MRKSNDYVDYRTDEEILSRRLSFVIPFANAAMTNFLTDEQTGKLFKAMIKYAEKQEAPDFSTDPLLGMCFANFKTSEDQNRFSYLQKSRQNRTNRYSKTRPEETGEPLTQQELDNHIAEEGLPYK